MKTFRGFIVIKGPLTHLIKACLWVYQQLPNVFFKVDPLHLFIIL